VAFSRLTGLHVFFSADGTANQVSVSHKMKRNERVSELVLDFPSTIGVHHIIHQRTLFTQIDDSCLLAHLAGAFSFFFKPSLFFFLGLYQNIKIPSKKKKEKRF